MITLYGFLCSHLTQTVILWNACRRWSNQLFAISNLSKESYSQSLSKRSAAIPNAEQCKDGIRAEALNANLEEKVNRGLRCKTDRQKRGRHLCARPNFEMSNQAGQCCNSLYEDCIYIKMFNWKPFTTKHFTMFTMNGKMCNVQNSETRPTLEAPAR